MHHLYYVDTIFVLTYSTHHNYLYQQTSFAHQFPTSNVKTNHYYLFSHQISLLQSA